MHQAGSAGCMSRYPKAAHFGSVDERATRSCFAGNPFPFVFFLLFDLSQLLSQWLIVTTS